MTQSNTARPPAGGVSERLALAALVGLALLSYMPTLGTGYIWDDDKLLVGNSLLTDPGGLRAIWTGAARIAHEDHYRPIPYTVWWVAYRLWGWQPWGYHLLNALLHAGVVTLAWRLLRRAGVAGAWLGAAIFAVHPVHVETVAWATEIKGLLAALFALLALDGYVRWEQDGRAWRIAAVAAWAAAAMLSKSAVVALPVGMLIWSWWRQGRVGRRQVTAAGTVLAVTLALALLDLAVVRANMGIARTTAVTPWERPACAARALAFYIGKLAAPVRLSPIYPAFPAGGADGWGWAALAGIVGLGAALWLARRRLGRGPLACGLFYLVLLAPALGVVEIRFLTITPAADRYQYLASLGPIAGVGAWVATWLGRARGRTRRGIGAALVVLLATLGVLTWRQTAFYHDMATLFRRAVAIVPTSPAARLNLAVGLVREGRPALARPQFEQALALNPDYALAHENLGSILAQTGEARAAERHYREALRLGGVETNTLIELGWLLATSTDPTVRNPAEALVLARRAVERTAGGNPLALDTLSAAQAATGQADEAAATARRALNLARGRGMSEWAKPIEQRLRLMEQPSTDSRPADSVAVDQPSTPSVSRDR